MWSLCDNTNPNAKLQEPLLGGHTAGIYGYTHAFGGYAGAHAQYVRVPHADIDCFTVPDGLRDEQVLSCPMLRRPATWGRTSASRQDLSSPYGAAAASV